ncbi:hypothetical protein MHF_1330 [Mycoplasma haemofelis Ohio2]|uniref:Uncharacterized protein n=1 Tax=Mycoplasma haemofelis (strain Ohio2) TaxID=859194 RepID=F6FG68_MYCHI|nr:hypothetical protein MHF_1330 [Mycoplasma haemofelis Ohio2]
MSIPLTKAAIGLGSVSGAAGLGYLSSSYLSAPKDKKVSISKLFEEQGRALLVRGKDTEQWKARWTAYVDGNKNDWKLGDYEAKKGDKTQAPESFVDACSSNAEVEVSGIGDPLYEQVVKHCSKEFSISELISKSAKFTILNTTESNQDTEAWKSSWQSYLEDNGDNNPWELSTGTWSAVKADKNNLPSDFKTKCGSKKDEKVFWDKDEKFVRFTRWCTKAN